MTFLQVKYFLAVVGFNSISRAADSLFVSRSAISRTLRELEEEYGVSLFERTISGVKLTPVGQIVYNRFLEIQHMTISLESHMNELRLRMTKKEDQEVKLCITPVTVQSVFPELYRKIKEQFPEIEIITTEADHLQAKNMMEEGNLDFQLTANATWSKNSAFVDRLVFYQKKYGLCMSPKNPLAKKEVLSIEDIRDEPIIVFDQHHTYQSDLEEQFDALGLKLNVAMRTYQLSTLPEMVRRGIGCTPMPQGVIDDGVDIVCVPLAGITWETALIWNSHAPHNTAFYNFLDVARQWKAELEGDGAE